ncbi:MAG: DNA repair protein RecN, partial [Bacteroidales bacterium]
MLQVLSIENYALIDRLQIRFDKGLSIVTGETGAGKSILLGALALLVGQRADTSVLKDKERNCVVEATFFPLNDELQTMLSQNDLDVDTQIIIRRMVNANGKSRAFINDQPVNLSTLKDFGERLIDIHSQHQNLFLQDLAFQLKVVDAIADNKNILENYQKYYQELRREQQKLSTLLEQSQSSQAEMEFWHKQCNELAALNLQEDEQAELEAELQQLTHAEEIKTNFTQASKLLLQDDGGALKAIRAAEHLLNKLSQVFDTAQNLSERLSSSLIDLKDIAHEIETIAEDTELNTQRLEYVGQRLDAIYALQKKHQLNSIKELLQKQSELEQKTSLSENIDEEIQELQKKCEILDQKSHTLATELSQKRQASFPQLIHGVQAMLQDLGIPNALLQIDCRESSTLLPTGVDEVRFLFSANKGIAPQELARIASGGEIARLMLCFKSLLAFKGNLPTIIFDEIDTGVSGQVADCMGEIIRELGKFIQVINITHLPQIASKGQAHYLVYKEETKEGVSTKIKQLKDEERVTHIAQMLSGQELTEAALKNARELLGKK